MVLIKVYYTYFENDNYVVEMEMYNKKYISEERVNELWIGNIENGHYLDYHIVLDTAK